MISSFSKALRNNLPFTEMKFVVNGEQQEREGPLTVDQLLGTLGLRTDRVAVEVNLKILSRNEFTTWFLQDGDTIEILSFIGGGTDSADAVTTNV